MGGGLDWVGQAIGRALAVTSIVGVEVLKVYGEWKTFTVYVGGFLYLQSYLPLRHRLPNLRSNAQVPHLPITTPPWHRDDPGSPACAGLLHLLGDMDIVLLRQFNLAALLSSSVLRLQSYTR